MSYAELQVTNDFSFLRGVSSAEELFATAAVLGIKALAVVDRNSLAGIVRAYEASRVTGVRLIVGCRLDLEDFPSVLVYPTDRAAYGRLCRLLTVGKARAGKGKCSLFIDDVAAWGEGLVAVLVTDKPSDQLMDYLQRMKAIFGNRAYCALTRRFRPDDAAHLHDIATTASQARVPTVVTGDVLYHQPGMRMLQDVVTCIRLKTTIDKAGFLKEKHADRFFKEPAEMERLFRRYPQAVARIHEIAERCRFSLEELTYSYPTEVLQDGLSAQDRLEKLTWEGAAQRYPEGVPDNVAMQLRHELGLIERLQYAPYFLTVDSIVRFARSKGILCQGRGSAANSAVCYVLGVTSIDPVRQGLLFERFVSEERREPPDIDVDFEHERREEVIQWIYETYGRTRSALTSTVTRYRARGAIREVGKALGIPEDVTGALARITWGWSEDGVSDRELKELNLNLSDRRLQLTLNLARQLMGTPRHLSQHPGGFVLTLDRLDELVPIEPAAMDNRQVIEWDKDDIETLKFMKVDVLGLGMLGCMRRAFDLLRSSKAIDLNLATIPSEDSATYEMIRKADTVGVFQIESRAQMSMLPRMAPKRFYDLVIEVAIVRPGPIQGDMVHPYLRRREGKEAVVFPKPELEKVLGKTLGVPLFQEQAMQVAMVAAGFSANEADQLRRAMATFKFTGGVNKFKDKLIQGMIDNGYDIEFANRTFRQLEGFGCLRISRKPCGKLRADRLRLQLDEMPSSRCILRSDPQRAAYGILRAVPACSRRQEPRRRDQAHRCEQILVGLFAGGDRRKVSRRPAWSAYDARPLRKRRQLPCRSAWRAALSDHPRTRPARGARDRRTGAAGEGGRLCLFGTFAQASVVGHQRAARRGATALRGSGAACSGDCAGANRGSSLASRYDARARGRRRLPLAWAVAATPSACFPQERARRP